MAYMATSRLTTTEAANYLGVSISTLYRMENRGLVKPSRTPGGQRRFSREELDAYQRKSTNFVAPQNPHHSLLQQSDSTGEQVAAEPEKSLELDLVYDADADDQDKVAPDPRNKLNDLSGKEWIVETKSVWFQKGLGASHPHANYERMHPAPFSFQDVSRLISFFSKQGETVLDPFSGIGSTTKACALSDRKATAIELSEHWMALSKERLDHEVGPGASNKHEWLTGDVRNILPDLPSSNYHFIVTSPPYWSILAKNGDHKVRNERTVNGLSTRYSTTDDDLGNIPDYGEFLKQIVEVFLGCGRVLKTERYLAIVVSDFRHKSSFISFHSDLIQGLNGARLDEHHRLVLQGTKVLLQNHKKLYPYGYPFAYVENIHHQYVLIFRKIPESKYRRKHEL